MQHCDYTKAKLSAYDYSYLQNARLFSNFLCCARVWCLAVEQHQELLAGWLAVSRSGGRLHGQLRESNVVELRPYVFMSASRILWKIQKWIIPRCDHSSLKNNLFQIKIQQTIKIFLNISYNTSFFQLDRLCNIVNKNLESSNFILRQSRIFFKRDCLC